jgi:8-oxo-dGTP diphosphatase
MSECAIVPYIIAFITRETACGREVLLTYRSNTDYPTDTYALIGGKIESCEAPSRAVIREVNEEVGLQVQPEDAQLKHILYFQGQTKPCVVFVFSIVRWSGEVINREPEKHSEVSWFPLDALPHNLFHRHIRIIKALENGLFYHEEGF